MNSIKLILFVSFWCTLSYHCFGQRDFTRELSESAKESSSFIEYRDSTMKYYSNFTKNYGGVYLFIIFKAANFDSKTGIVKIEGFTAAAPEEPESVGIGGVPFFLAQPVDGYLKNIRMLGISDSIPNNRGKPEGYFYFETKINRNDRLYFSSDKGEALQEFVIGEVLYKER